MATKVEEFDIAELRNARVIELREQGYKHISKTFDSVPITWKQIYIVSYDPELPVKPEPEKVSEESI